MTRCEAQMTYGRQCRQRVALRRFEGADGEQHAYCSVPYHRAQVERRFGVAGHMAAERVEHIRVTRPDLYAQAEAQAIATDNLR